MTRLSIRCRLTLWYSIALGVILCGFCLVLLLLMRQQVFARTDAGLREEVEEIGLEIGLADTAEAFKRQAQARFSQHDFYDFLVVDEAGRIIFFSSEQKDQTVDRLASFDGPKGVRIETLEVGDRGAYRIAATSLESSFGNLNLQVMRSLRPIYADLHTLQWAMIGLLPVVVALALTTGYFLAGHALRPVQQVVDAANSISISCLDRRIEVANSHDEIGKLAAALNSLIARLEKAVTEIRRFTADASHEIRTPIASLRLEAETALLSPRSSREYTHTLAIVVEETTRLGRLADQLLSLSRHDAGITQRANEPVQIDALVRDVVDHLRPFADSSGVELECACDLPCEVLGDDIRLSQVFFNILENAIKYSASGGRVLIRMRCEAERVVIDVEDTGMGISARDLPHVFDRFFRVDPSRHIEGGGAGLGLSIAKAAVESHQGTITISSQLGTGTTLTVSLPISGDIAKPISSPTGLLEV